MTEREIARKKEAARKARKERERKARNRRIALTMCLLLVVCVASIGGTIAWLTDSTGTVKNTFTSSDVDIDLTETLPANKTAKMVPSLTINKDPKVKVLQGSEACWVFVRIEKSDNFDSFMSYTVDSAWTQLSGVDGVYVYYREHAATPSADSDSYSILKGDKVTVKDTVTKAMMDALTADTYPTLSFTAYAIQKEGISSASDAWAKVPE